MRKTGIQVDKIKKVMNVSVSGKMTLEDSKAFIADYNTKTRSINAKEFELNVDCTEMELLKQDMYEDLTNVMKMYKSTGFKHVKFVIKGNQFLKMQLTRLSKSAGLTESSVVGV